MQFNFSKNLGFTLVELLVVIAIIGILSSVAVVNLGSARDKAKIAAMQETLSSLRPVTLLCFSNEEELLGAGGDSCADALVKPESGFQLCSGVDALWPNIVDQYENWDYCVCDSDYANGAYEFAVSNSSCDAAPGSTDIICNQSTCEVIQHP